MSDKAGGTRDRRTPREMHLEREKMWKASIANHARYLDASTGFIAEEHTTLRNCPACGADDARFMFQKSGGLYHNCNKCSMVYLNPALTDDALTDYYRNNHAVQGEVVAEDMSFYRSLYERGIASIEKFKPGKEGLLDVGCSTGIFLDIAKERGWPTFGLELNKAEIKIAVSKGHDIAEGLIATAGFDRTFDAISLWDVFEHIKDGHTFLSDARPLLNPGGIVFIQSPSRDALAARVMQVACNMFDGLEHVNLYGFNSLKIVAEANGFKVVNFETVISEIGVMNNYLDYDDPYLGGTTDTKSLAGLVSEDEIHAKRLGYKFQACLQRKS